MALLSPELMTRLSRLFVGSRKRGPGVQVGERRSQRRGHSQEFADHRPYVPGDDLRFLDWHVYGRMDTLWVKLFEEEQDRVVQLLLDTSASMEGEKLDQARRVAAALAFVSLAREDRVAVGGLSDKLDTYAPPRRGRAQTHAVFQTLEGMHPGGRTDLARALEGWPHQRGSGIGLLFSDFLHPEGPEMALRRLLARGGELHAFHVVAPGELRPDIDGDLTLIDRETGEEVSISVDERVLDRYESAMNAWIEDVAAICRRLGVGHVVIRTDVPVDELVLRDLRRLGVIA